jgi:hypothetical protein
MADLQVDSKEINFHLVNEWEKLSAFPATKQKSFAAEKPTALMTIITN